MARPSSFDDVLQTLWRQLEEGLERVVAAGARPDQVIVDPGIGFVQGTGNNLLLLSLLPELQQRFGRPVLVGASRKSFIGRLLTDRGKGERPVDDREDATQAITAIAAWEGVWGVRVHAVRPAADAVRVAAAIRAAGQARHGLGPWAPA
jgi:dihydropteroate synthase